VAGHALCAAGQLQQRAAGECWVRVVVGIRPPATVCCSCPPHPQCTLTCGTCSPPTTFTSQAVQAAEAAHAALRLPSFEHEAQRVSQRAAAGCGSAAGPTKPRVGLFQVLPARPGAPASAPPPSAALALLHRLAGDPAIVHIMTMHGWSVGLMSEMPPGGGLRMGAGCCDQLRVMRCQACTPAHGNAAAAAAAADMPALSIASARAEGRVGISAVCILGYNVNRGQEVSLRLRTDDYAGVRARACVRACMRASARSTWHAAGPLPHHPSNRAG
jgi:hypothetical protein